MFAIVEKDNENAVHGLFYSKEKAEHHIENTIPGYVAKGYFTNKSLTADSFKVISHK